IHAAAELEVPGPDFHVFQVDVHLQSGGGGDRLCELPDVVLFERHAGHAERGGVTEENLRETLGDHGPETEAVNRLRSVFTARAAAEVGVGNEDAGSGVFRLVDRVAAVQVVTFVADVAEQVFTEPVERHAAQVARGDDAVGVDVVTGHVHGGAGHGFYGIESHVRPPRFLLNRILHGRHSLHPPPDRQSTPLHSSHASIPYAVYCLTQHSTR